MKDFAKSIVCNVKAEVAKVGNTKCKNAEIVKDGDVWVVLYAEGTKSKEFDSEAEAKKFAAQIGNSKVWNAFDFETQAVVDRKEAVKTAEEELRKAEAERNKHRGERYWEEAYITAKKDVERAKENLARAQRNKAGNRRVGNTDLLSGNYIILDDEGAVWFRDEHENVNIRNIDSWAQKRISEYQRSIDEIKRGVQEAKQAAKKYGLI